MIAAGYNLKIIEEKPEWLKSHNVKRIYSVSECISKCPIDHFKEWKFNDLLFYDNEETLLSLIENQKIHEQVRWFFYEIYEKELIDGKWNEINIKHDSISKNNTYIFRGYDIVCYSTGQSHECSPLSCNNGADKFKVNEYCLVDSFDYAKKVAEAIDKEGNYEPGPYRILSVYEKI